MTNNIRNILPNNGRKNFLSKIPPKSIFLFIGSFLVVVGFLVTVLSSTVEAAWWNEGGAWSNRKQLTLTNTSGDSLASGTTVAVSINTKELFQQGKLQSNCEDIRVVYQPNETTYTDLDRYVLTDNNTVCSDSEATQIYFRLQATLGGTVDDDDYYLYYGNANASAPTSTVDAFDAGANALFVCPFKGTPDCVNSSGSVVANTETGAIRYAGIKSALQFDGVDDYLQSGDSSPLSITGDVTVEAWIKLKRTGAEQTLVAKWDETTANDDRSYRLYLTSSNNFAFSISTDGTSGNTTTITGTTTTAEKGTWYHVAGVYDASAQTLDLYVNGASDATQIDSAGGSISDNASNLYLGAKENTSGVLDTYFLGIIDEVRLSSSSRYDSNFTPPGGPFVLDYYTQALYHFDESGDDPRNSSETKDSTANGNNLTITGATYVSGHVGIDGPSEFGSHTGSNNASVLIDSSASWADDEWVGYILYNSTDASHGAITSNTANTITATLAGGTENDWDAGDLYTLSPDLGKVVSQADSAHFGTFVEEGTTNKIDNPSFENTTYDTSWSEGSGSGVVTAVTRTTADTGGGTQDITNSNLGGNTPKAALFIVSYATTDGTARNTAALSYGAATGTSNEWVISMRDQDATTSTSHPRTHISTSESIFILDPTLNSDSSDGTAEFTTFITNGVRINWTVTPVDAFLMTVVLFAGDELSAHANSAALGNSTNNAVDVTAPGFEPDVVLAGTGIGNLAAIRSSLGMVHNDGAATITQRSFFTQLGQISTSNFVYLSNLGGVGELTGAGNLDWYGEFGSFDSSGFTVTTRNAGANNTTMYYLALDLGSTVESWVGDHLAQNSTGNYAETGPGFTPQIVLQQMTFGEAYATSYSDNRGGVFGVNVFDANEDYATSFASEDGVGTTNTQSLSDDIAVNISDDDGTTGIEGAFVSFDVGSGWTTNYTAVESADKIFPSLAISALTFLTRSIETNEPYVRFGSRSAKIVASGADTTLINSLDPGNTNTHTLSFYAYLGTVGSEGGTIDNTIARVLWEGTDQSSTVYQNVGGGWWRLSYSAATTNATNDYGLWIADGETLYVDGFMLEEKATATTYTDGSLGTGYTWSGDINESTSSRAAADLDYLLSGNLQASAGSVSFWVKPYWNGNDGMEHTFFDVDASAGNLRLYKSSSNVLTFTDGTNSATSSISGWSAGAWHHVVGTWGGGNITIYVDSSAGTPGGGFSAPTLGSNLYVGQSSSNTNLANAMIGDFRIYDAAMTSTAVTDSYYAGLVVHQQGVPVDRFDNTKGDSPRAVWHFDEGYGTTVYDASQYHYDLTLSSATWAVGQNNTSVIGNSYLRFDGSNDYLVKPDDTDFRFGVDSFSLQGWFRHSSIAPSSGTDTLLAKFGSAGFKVYMNTSGFVCFGIDDDASWTVQDEVCSTVNLADSSWHRFDAVKDGISSITLYIDGVQVAQDASLAANGSLSSTASFYIGIDSDGVSNAWQGDLDEVSIYTYARTATQIKNDITGSQTAFVLGTGKLNNLADGLGGYWDMDEASSNTCVGGSNDSCDSSGNGNDGLWIGDVAPTAGKFGNAVTLDNSADFIRAGTGSVVSQTGPLTLAAWVNSQLTDTEGIMAKAGNSANRGFYFEILANDTVTFGVSDASGNPYIVATTTTTLSPNVWHHVAAVYNPSTYLRVYVDGELAAETTTNVPASRRNSSTQFAIGVDDNDGNPLHGLIDEARMYNRALSASEIKQLYEWAPGMVAYWPFDENIGTTSVYDRSGSGFIGSLTNVTESAWVSGQLGSALELNGSTSFVDIGVGPSMVNSVAFWVYPETTTEYFLNLTGTTDYIWANAGTVTATGLSSPTIYVNGIESSTITSGEWQHIAVVTDVSENANNLEVGRTADTDYLEGKIDDVRLYNYVRSASQILEDMNGGHPVGGSPIASQVGWWKLDELYGSTAYDSIISSGNDLTLVASPIHTAEGRYTRAIDFESGSSQYAYASDSTSLSLIGDVSLSAWIKPESTTAATQFNIAGKWDGSNESYLLAQYGDEIRMYIDSASDYETTSNADLQVGTWYHVVGVYDSSEQSVSVYIDGVLQSSATTGTIPSSIGDDAGRFHLAAEDSTTTAANFYDGIIDDVKLYSTALTLDQVLIDRNANAAINLGVGSHGADDALDGAPPSPLAYWDFDENTGTSSVIDKTGNGYTANMDGSMTEGDWVPGKYGSGLDFDGSDDDLTVTDASGIRFDGTTQDFSLFAWVKRNDLGIGGAVISKKDVSTDGYEMSIQNASRAVRCRINSVIANGSTAIDVDGKWHHIGCVFDRDGNVSVYLDGRLDNTPVSISGQNLATTANLFIAQSLDLGNLPATVLDEVKIFDSVLTSSQVAYMFDRGAPHSWWKMDECTGSTLYDSGIRGNNGTIVPSTGTAPNNNATGNCGSGNTDEMWNDGTTGKRNASLGFDGSNDHAYVTDHNSLTFGNSNRDFSFSFSFWAYAFSDVSADLVSKADIAGGTEYRIFLVNSNDIVVYLQSAAGSGSLTFTAEDAFAQNQWQHITFTYDGSSNDTGGKIYINGVEQAITGVEGGTYVAMENTNEHLIFGARWNGSSTANNLNGLLDDIRMYQYELSPRQVKTIMNTGAVYFGQ